MNYTVSDADGGSYSNSFTITVVEENAFITFDSDNPVTKQVANPGDAGVTLDSEEFIIYVTQEADGNLGAQNLTGTLAAKLVPVGGGGAIDLVQVGAPDLSAFPGGGGQRCTPLEFLLLRLFQ